MSELLLTIRGWPRRTRLGLVLAITAGFATIAFLLPRVAQPLWYHDFADTRAWMGVPRAADVLSNVAFLLGGLIGFVALGRSTFLDERERIPFAVFFGALALTTFGSAYYHLAPNNSRLFWDRLPITIAFMALAAAVLADRISPRAGLMLLPLLVSIGAASDLHWILTEQAGRGDLRFYALVQAGGATVPYLILLMFAPRYSRGAGYLWAGACYGAAKLAEVLDKPVFSAGHLVSGHTLKHLLAGASGLVLARMLAWRGPIGQSKSAQAGS